MFRCIFEYQEIVVHKIEEYESIINAYKDFYNINHDSSSNVGRQVYFRGQANAKWDIEPSILHPSNESSSFLNKHNIPSGLSLFETIAFIQHYNTGTRFIDFTLNPYIALYFACNKDSSYNGSVFIYSCSPYNDDWLSAIILTELEQIDTKKPVLIESLSKNLIKKYIDIKTKFSNIEDLDMYILSFIDHGFMVLPKSNTEFKNKRLYYQEGCFYICGYECTEHLTALDKSTSYAGKISFNPSSVVVPDSLKNKIPLIKLIIPKENKSRFLKYLSDNKGINSNYLFPD